MATSFLRCVYAHGLGLCAEILVCGIGRATCACNVSGLSQRTETTHVYMCTRKRAGTCCTCAFGAGQQNLGSGWLAPIR